MFHPRITVLLDITYQISFKFSQNVAFIKPRSHRSSGGFLCMRNFLLYRTYLLIVFFPDILRSCDRKFVFHLWALARCHRTVIVNVIVANRKRELSQKPNLCLWGVGNVPQKIFEQRKCLDNLSSLINKSLQNIYNVPRLLKRCHNESF